MSIPFLVANYQTYVTALKRPTTSSWSGTATYGTHSNDNLAYDIVAGYENAINDTTETYSNLACSPLPRTRPGVANSTIIYTGFGTGAFNGTINVSSTGVSTTVYDLNGINYETGVVSIYYCTDYPTGTWILINDYDNLDGGGSDSSLNWTKDRVFAYSGAVANRATIAVKVVCESHSSGTTLSTYAGGGCNVSVYDIILT